MFTGREGPELDNLIEARKKLIESENALLAYGGWKLHNGEEDPKYQLWIMKGNTSLIATREAAINIEENTLY